MEVVPLGRDRHINRWVDFNEHINVYASHLFAEIFALTIDNLL